MGLEVVLRRRRLFIGAGVAGVVALAIGVLLLAAAAIDLWHLVPEFEAAGAGDPQVANDPVFQRWTMQRMVDEVGLLRLATAGIVLNLGMLFLPIGAAVPLAAWQRRRSMPPPAPDLRIKR